MVVINKVTNKGATVVAVGILKGTSNNSNTVDMASSTEIKAITMTVTLLLRPPHPIVITTATAGISMDIPISSSDKATEGHPHLETVATIVEGEAEAVVGHTVEEAGGRRIGEEVEIDGDVDAA